MKSLFISTATKRLVVAITDGDEIKYSYNEENGTDLSTKIMPIIDEAFKTSGLKPNDIDVIFAVDGPGSFTGIRIGLTIAKVMAWSLNIKVIPVSSLELMASTTNNNKYVMPLIDARRGYVFGALYDHDLNTVVEDKHILLDELLKLSKDDTLYVSDDTLNIETSVSEYNFLPIIKKHMNDDGINPHMLNPRYLKLTEAEEKFNEGR